MLKKNKNTSAQALFIIILWWWWHEHKLFVLSFLLCSRQVLQFSSCRPDVSPKFATLALGKQRIHFLSEFYHRSLKPSFYTPFSNTKHISSTPWVSPINTRVLLYLNLSNLHRHFYRAWKRPFSRCCQNKWLPLELNFS